MKLFVILECDAEHVSDVLAPLKDGIATFVGVLREDPTKTNPSQQVIQKDQPRRSVVNKSKIGQKKEPHETTFGKLIMENLPLGTFNYQNEHLAKVADDNGYRPSSVSSVLTSAVRSGKLVHTGRGMYRRLAPVEVAA